VPPYFHASGSSAGLSVPGVLVVGLVMPGVLVLGLVGVLLVGLSPPQATRAMTMTSASISAKILFIV